MEIYVGCTGYVKIVEAVEKAASEFIIEKMHKVSVKNLMPLFGSN